MRCGTEAIWISRNLAHSGVPGARSKGGKNFRKAGKDGAAPVMNI